MFDLGYNYTITSKIYSDMKDPKMTYSDMKDPKMTYILGVQCQEIALLQI